MKRAGERFATALRFTLVGHARNRLAIILIVLFLPVWIYSFRAMAAQKDVRFRLRAVGQDVIANTSHMTQVCGALNVVTAIVGFMMFMATFHSGPLDRRLVLAGYGRAQLVLAKGTALLLLSALISAYTTALLSVTWGVRQPWLMSAALFSGAITYGGIGILLGALLSGELEGVLCVILTDIFDLGSQNPVTYPSGDGTVLPLLPLYGALQSALAARFTDTSPVSHLLLGPLWFGLTAAMGLTVFFLRTRRYPTREALMEAT
ncbi:ABC transporter permease [Streptomyces abikoensis]|uniref:ABC transporter permease n=1 Tax=Streptomyces abikoensis TaxID=97398 RepID=A0ABW7THH8_9ACTN